MQDLNLFNCDCQEYYNSEFADLICTDPPYILCSGGSKSSELGGCFKTGVYDNRGEIVPCNITWKQIMQHCYNALKADCHAYIMTNNRNMQEALFEAEQAGFKLHNILVWDKGTVTPNRFYMNRVEFCLFLYKGKAKFIKDMGLSNIFTVHNEKGNGHPTEKPVELMRCWIEQSTEKGQLVYDPFMGIGATGIAAKQLERDFIGCEIKKEYFDIAVKRIEEETRQKSLF